MKPELLLPAGDIESFYAAIEGGADAVYLGLRNFNARGRATNFSPEQLQALLLVAEEKNIKVYVTLNTVIKNEEIPELLDTLYFLSKSTISAVIIQDWGVYDIIKEHFPSITMHASTQMGNHNSAGANFSEKHGFERVIMARELTFNEYETISNKTNIEIEAFTHGALCYSMSGMCMLSSYLGGNGANRGICTQPCRRKYKTVVEDEVNNNYIFSLKDHQLIEFIPELMELGISSFKIEGRMKSAEYVYTVAKAYRMVIDNDSRVDEAVKLLEMDLGREKTPFFVGNSLLQAMTENPTTGLLIGKVTKTTEDTFSYNSKVVPANGNRIRVISYEDNETRETLKLRDYTTNKRNFVTVTLPNHNIEKGDLIFLSSANQLKFKTKFDSISPAQNTKLPQNKKKEILESIRPTNQKKTSQLFFRVNNINWMKKLYIKGIDKVILALPKREWSVFRTGTPFMQKNAKKFIIELPKFIPENDIDFYKRTFKNLSRDGFNHFMISHISQKEILPKGAKVSSNENVYIFNDSAINFLQKEEMIYWTYPQENDMENLYKGKDRHGIVPLYYTPELFFSRVPIKTYKNNENLLEDDRENKFKKVTRDGMTIIIPEVPVSLLQYKRTLEAKGFYNFLIDLTHDTPSSNRYDTVSKKFKFSEQVQPSNTFNFKKGLS
ncbi:MAG: peptidase U32 family protein [Bacteroidota bacterium]|nr:peptidase U32 family protein [Bacteroidota bacterium]